MPGSWAALLAPLRPVFRRRTTFAMFTILATGLVARTGRRSVVGMLAGAKMAGQVSFHAACRFFSHAVWDIDQLGLAVGSYLVGVAAALKTRKGTVGFIGGCQVDLIKKFEAGFTAGAKATKPDIQVKVNYLSTPAEACKGFNDPTGGNTAARGMYDQGADIIYAAAGGSGTGVFEAAKAKKTLAIGVDSDQYNTVTDASLKPVIMTSMLKRVDNAVFNFVKDVADGKFKAGSTVLGLKVDGVGYATSGGQVDDIKDKLDAVKADIASGKITVPAS